MNEEVGCLFATTVYKGLLLISEKVAILFYEKMFEFLREETEILSLDEKQCFPWERS